MKLLTVMFLIALNVLSAASKIHPEIKAIKDRNVLRVAILEKPIPPFIMKNKEGELFGYSIDIAREMAKVLGVRVEFIKVGNSEYEVIDSLNTADVDIAMSYLKVSLKKAEEVYFTHPHLVTDKLLLVNRLYYAAKNRNESNTDFINRKSHLLRVRKDSADWEFANYLYPEAEVLAYPSVKSDILQQTLENKAIYVSDDITAKTWFHETPSAAIHIESIILHESPNYVSFAIKHDKYHLQHWVELFVDKSKNEGLFQKYEQKYLNAELWGSEISAFTN